MSEPDNTKLNRHSIIYRGLSNGAQGRRGGGDGAQGRRVGRLCTGEKKGGNGAQGRRGLMVHIENGGEGVQGRRCTEGRGVVHRRNGAVKREERGAATI